MSSCRVRRHRPPPSDDLIASSCRRTRPRASSRSARLRHATSRTMAGMIIRSTASSRHHCATSRTRHEQETPRRRHLEGVAGVDFRIRLLESPGHGGERRRGSLDRAPARSRPTQRSREVRVARASACRARGIHTSGPGMPPPVNPFAATPITVKGSPLTRTVRPTMFGSAPRCSQNAWLTIATRYQRQAVLLPSRTGVQAPAAGRRTESSRRSRGTRACVARRRQHPDPRSPLKRPTGW